MLNSGYYPYKWLWTYAGDKFFEAEGEIKFSPVYAYDLLLLAAKAPGIPQEVRYQLKSGEKRQPDTDKDVWSVAGLRCTRCLCLECCGVSGFPRPDSYVIQSLLLALLCMGAAAEQYRPSRRSGNNHGAGMCRVGS
jgi:hypothetical protein